MTVLTEKQEKLHAQLAEAATDPDRLVVLGAALREVDDEIERVESAWLEAAELAEG
jgi:ATP-binding cassette subfamily F protein uup